ncbi:MAG TPA: endolytic transglycosylase MltG [Candidatus Gracilibacteria bacterium]|mgnify:CR=1 FL=1|nr:endolytic transglycosylase MltG [Candidatus Gracilibacteria bacterium]
MRWGILLLILITGFSFWAWRLPHTLNSSTVKITVNKGDSVRVIADKLQSAKVIKSSFAFYWYLRAKKADTLLQAGNFSIPSGLTWSQLLDQLQKAESSQFSLLIREGDIWREIKAKLQNKGFLVPTDEVILSQIKSEFPFLENSLEGYLFPDTYFVDELSLDVLDFLRKALQNFQDQFLSAENKVAIQKSGKSLAEIVIMASMVEKEENTEENRPLVAGVLWSRLQKGIALGVDATTRYELGKNTEPLYRSDFESNSPYNTRRQKGLPPTAISNPSLSALQAALYPQASDYLYYLHDARGQIHFAKTNDEHNKNRFQYLK